MHVFFNARDSLGNFWIHWGEVITNTGICMTRLCYIDGFVLQCCLSFGLTVIYSTCISVYILHSKWPALTATQILDHLLWYLLWLCDINKAFQHFIMVNLRSITRKRKIMMLLLWQQDDSFSNLSLTPTFFFHFFSAFEFPFGKVTGLRAFTIHCSMQEAEGRPYSLAKATQLCKWAASEVSTANYSETIFSSTEVTVSIEARYPLVSSSWGTGFPLGKVSGSLKDWSLRYYCIQQFVLWFSTHTLFSA